MPSRFGSSSVHSISSWDVAGRTENNDVILANRAGVFCCRRIAIGRSAAQIVLTVRGSDGLEAGDERSNVVAVAP